MDGFWSRFHLDSIMTGFRLVPLRLGLDLISASPGHGFVLDLTVAVLTTALGGFYVLGSLSLLKMKNTFRNTFWCIS